MTAVNADIIFTAPRREKIARNCSLYHEIMAGIKEYETPLAQFMTNTGLGRDPGFWRLSRTLAGIIQEFVINDADSTICSLVLLRLEIPFPEDKTEHSN